MYPIADVENLAAYRQISAMTVESNVVDIPLELLSEQRHERPPKSAEIVTLFHLRRVFKQIIHLYRLTLATL